MSDKIKRIEPITDWNKVNPDYVSKRDLKGKEEFQRKLQREIQDRLKQQKKKANP